MSVNSSSRSPRLRSLPPPRSTRTHPRSMSPPPLLLSRTPLQRHRSLRPPPRHLLLPLSPLPPLRRPSPSRLHPLLHLPLLLPHKRLRVYHLPSTNLHELVYSYVSLISVFCLFKTFPALLVIMFRGIHSDTQIFMSFLYHITLLSGSSSIPFTLR